MTDDEWENLIGYSRLLESAGPDAFRLGISQWLASMGRPREEAEALVCHVAEWRRLRSDLIIQYQARGLTVEQASWWSDYLSGRPVPPATEDECPAELLACRAAAVGSCATPEADGDYFHTWLVLQLAAEALELEADGFDLAAAGMYGPAEYARIGVEVCEHRWTRWEPCALDCLTKGLHPDLVGLLIYRACKLFPDDFEGS